MASQSINKRTVMKIFILNLAQSTDRLAQQQKQFDQLGLDFERLPAVSVADIDAPTYQKYLTAGQRVIKQTELACLFSHKKAWEQVISHNQPCIILEDDAVLVKDFANLLENINNINEPNIDFINLEVHGRQKIVGKKPVATINDYHLYELFLDKSGTGGYIIYPTGAKKLLAQFAQKVGLADTFIYQCPDLHKVQIEPAALLQSDRCQMYGVPFDDYELKSLIGTINNQLTIKPTFWQKIILKKNRIIAQIALGFRTLSALSKGIKREIFVDKDKF